MSTTSVELNVTEAGGGGETVVLLHGLGGDRSVWDDYLGPLGADRRVLAFDLRGFGASGSLPETTAMSEHARDVAAEIARRGAGPAIVVGHSMGGMVAQQLAVDSPQLVRALVLIDTLPGAGEEYREMNAPLGEAFLEQGAGPVAEGLQATMYHPDSLERRPPFIEDVQRVFARTDPRKLWAAIQAINGYEVRARLAALDKPTLVICGEADLMLPDAEWTAAEVPGARLVVVEGAGHMAPVEAPGAVLAEMQTFLAELDPVDES
ncbi:MAG TPA: alpha/beta fold hydrolase [Solirubrobacterales bacterium]|jgi:3-oxoadipate enol-lactonase|nr:alpha/beta fold hydrolase [Solirubrobacterales bacterium]